MVAIRIRELDGPGNGLMVWDKGAEEYRPVRLWDMGDPLRSWAAGPRSCQRADERGDFCAYACDGNWVFQHRGGGDGPKPLAVVG